MIAIWIAIAALSALALAFGLVLGYASRRFEVENDPIVEEVEAMLPQSQCGQCGYPGCRPYAEAVALNGESINKCGPGGEAMMLKLAEKLNVDPQPLEGDTDVQAPTRQVAWIDESNCIGCTKCIQACPVDAIIGSTKAVHTVVSDLCTGCDLCVSPCPTDCIELRPIAPTPANWKWDLDTIPVRVIQVERHA
ncbi:electron transport complex subunit RsxB [Pectobacterium brasiliense]|uniref:Ion-translocating oxidoreductase complex subunit B n=1 Tax=Pectobacterium brasiliense TaxID=180957 RepID=A0A433N9L1_9GAMM|nr:MULTISPECIES: electron transport complex subunit RsxB [Pectobacterium]GKW27477.1 electron transport complex subunit RsxB [Pectobacterium carotovorum subsp. carotovorum]MBN3049011.1 electron transport complex subunit RsxB [Pectobacterium brasiliense]MBN3077262.1 electron transport complex subunit RsxB [Pectobacterium brasiliense]MBN3085004.1 electron transport complex subunit RsxB [Pectobacterium brasiliense]MBN3090885.1 electron transport complex subunit RsxB [Pectobacterium brasiliense]